MSAYVGSWTQTCLQSSSSNAASGYENYSHCVVLLCTGVEEAGSDEMMSLVQEAHIVSMDIGDDRLGDDEWNLLSNTASLVQIHIQIFWPDHLV